MFVIWPVHLRVYLDAGRRKRRHLLIVELRIDMEFDVSSDGNKLGVCVLIVQWRLGDCIGSQRWDLHVFYSRSQCITYSSSFSNAFNEPFAPTNPIAWKSHKIAYIGVTNNDAHSPPICIAFEISFLSAHTSTFGDCCWLRNIRMGVDVCAESQLGLHIVLSNWPVFGWRCGQRWNLDLV